MAQVDVQVGPDLWVRTLPLEQLHEQPVNAQVMAPAKFDRLVENIRKRGALESMPYCSQPGGKGKVWIVSGHHRTRAARAAGLTEVPVLVDTSEQTRSEVVARQIAHNALHGEQDEEVMAQMLSEVTTADDLLATGLDENQLPAVGDAPPLPSPQAAVEWKVCSLVFLPAQLDDFKALVDALDGRQELVGAAPVECYDAFAQALGAVARVTATRSMAAVVSLLTELALDLVAKADEAEDGES